MVEPRGERLLPVFFAAVPGQRHEQNLTSAGEFPQLAGDFIADRPPRGHVTARRVDRERWLFEVRDNGTGIEPQYFQKISEVGERLHGRKIAGTGFGLANSHRIVERHGGTIWVESQVGSGSTFAFLLPACDSAPSEPGAGRRRAEAAAPAES